MAEVSTKPYLIRAIHEWCSDSGYTPYIAVVADDKVNVPREFVKNGEIVLNISPLATSRLSLGNEFIEFQARFGGVAREVSVPIEKVIAIYARENGQGMAFDLPGAATPAGVPAAAAQARSVGACAGRAGAGRQAGGADRPHRRPQRAADSAAPGRSAQAHPGQVTFRPDSRPWRSRVDRHAGIAQLVEHLICNQRVGGSSPSAGTISPLRPFNQTSLDHAGSRVFAAGVECPVLSSRVFHAFSTASRRNHELHI